MKKYIVYITYYSGTKLPPFYIGSSYEEKIKNGYNGSIGSKKYKEIYKLEQKENKHLFRTKILSCHSSNEESLTEELRLQKMHLVVKNKRYFNESYAQIDGSHGRDVKGELNPNFGNKWSEKQKSDMSLRITGTVRTANSKKKQSETISGENHWNYGKSHSKETKRKIGNNSRGRESSKKGISAELFYGIEKSKEISEKIKESSYHSASSYKERFGATKAKEIAEKLSISNSGEGNPNASEWKLISPLGNISTTFGGINDLIISEGLSIGTMKKFINKGKILTKHKSNKHNGWEIIKIK